MLNALVARLRILLDLLIGIAGRGWQTWPCPACGRRISKRALKCPFCGTWRAWETAGRPRSHGSVVAPHRGPDARDAGRRPALPAPRLGVRGEVRRLADGRI